MSLDKNSKERKKLFSLLRNKGNFIRNSKQIVKPVKKSIFSDASY